MNTIFLRYVAAFVVLAVAVAGCASGGNDVLRTQDANAVNQYIIDGKTTRSDVERIYGTPTETSFANAQNEVWIYRWTRKTLQPENFIPYVGPFVGGVDVQKKELVILFNEQNVVIRHSMRDSTDAIRRNLSSSSSPTSNSSPQISTSPAPQPGSPSSSVEPPVASVTAAPPSTVAPSRAATSGPMSAALDPARWRCAITNTGNANPYFVQFVVAADRTITVGSYANAPATIVKNDPLTFTAINPRGSRLITFTLKPDYSMIVAGPSLNNPSAAFSNDGTCTKI